MTPDQIAMVKESFVDVAAIQDEAADLFYERLFDVAPQLRSMFPDDLSEQKIKLMKAIALVVGSLDNLEGVIEVVRDMGRHHAGYGVRTADYETVGAALLWTLKRGLGESWTPDMAEAWTQAYGTLAGVMISAAAEEKRSAA